MTSGMPEAFARQMERYNAICGYETIELLKDGPLGRTELVEGPAGRTLVRKFIHLDNENHLHAYERTCGLDLPHLPRVEEALRVGDELIVLMEHIEGPTLHKVVLANRSLKLNDMLSIFRDVCDALSSLHELDGGAVVHRDVNPGNIIVSPKGTYLTDLGIARTWDAQASSDTSLWGTAGYAAPEQFGFAQSDVRTDIYGLGMTLRFMLAGADPGAGATIDRKYERIVERCTALDPQKRYEEVADVYADFEYAATDFASSLQSSLRGLTRRSTLARVLWWVWRILSFTTALIAIESVWTTAADPEMTLTTSDALMFSIFWIAVPWLICSNPCGFTHRIPWLRKNRYLMLLALIAGSYLCIIPWELLTLLFSVFVP